MTSIARSEVVRSKLDMYTRAVVDRIEEEVAVLKTQSGDVTVPLPLLPDGVGEGSVVYLEITDTPGETKDKKIEAKEILNTLLKGR